MRIGKCSLSVQCLFRDFAIRYNNKWGKQMKTNYFGTLGCLAFVAIVTVCTVELDSTYGHNGNESQASKCAEVVCFHLFTPFVVIAYREISEQALNR